MSVILKNVACLRGQNFLFEGVNLSLNAGDAALVTGPNGIGKSSLLRLVAGLLPPVAGIIEIGGRIALADENMALPPQHSLNRALEYWAKLDGGGNTQVDYALEAMQLSRLRTVPIHMLSTGQRKRATLARVIAGRADLWLLDEPGNGLDNAALKLLETAMTAHRAGGGMIIAASHQSLHLPNAQILEMATYQPKDTPL